MRRSNENISTRRTTPIYLLFRFSKQITENRCLQRCLDVSLDVMRQINSLWESLEKLAPLFNISTKADFLVRKLTQRTNMFHFVLHFQVGIKCLETAVYGACKRVEILSVSLVEITDSTEDNPIPNKVCRSAQLKIDSFSPR